MGEGDQRQSKRVVRYDSRELARLSKRHVPTEAEWDEKVASGGPKDAAAALMSRTSTVDDPLTTSLLAEVTRRSMTVEVSADQIDEARALVDHDPSDEPA